MQNEKRLGAFSRSRRTAGDIAKSGFVGQRTRLPFGKRSDLSVIRSDALLHFAVGILPFSILPPNGRIRSAEGKWGVAAVCDAPTAIHLTKTSGLPCTSSVHRILAHFIYVDFDPQPGRLRHRKLPLFDLEGSVNDVIFKTVIGAVVCQGEVGC